ncbi:glycoside hydrolase family 65 protein, partial [Zhouia sp. PK063]
MNQDYIIPHEWSIIEEGFDPSRVQSSESLFSLGNGAMGQRANFEEHYSGKTFQGSYIGGVYYPDKTKVGWWKNGYPEYFAKVLNAPNWIGIHVLVNNEELDLFTCKKVTAFKRELNMKEGWYKREFIATLRNDIQIKVTSKRFLSICLDEVGAINYSITPLNTNAVITLCPYIDAGIENKDTNWEERFWEVVANKEAQHQAFLTARTLKTHFYACTFMQNTLFYKGETVVLSYETQSKDTFIKHVYRQEVKKGEEFAIQKIGGYVTSLHHSENDLVSAAKNVLNKVSNLGFDVLLHKQKAAWSTVWDMADITIEGDVKAQQGIRFNIFQLNQTYTGADHRLNIGPKGFTGEKYGGSTYWDT